MRIECAYKELVEVNKLIPHPENRNKHSDDQVRALAKIIAKVGQRSPIVVSTLSGKINKGHCRWAAIKMLGWEKCAVDYQDYENELEELNDRIADNEIQRLSEFDHVGFMDDLDKLGLDKNDLDFEEFGLVDFKIGKDSSEDKEVDYGDKNKEINLDEFGRELNTTCPKCGFEFASEND